MITVTNKITGEVIELDDKTQEQLVDAWRMASELEKISKYIKDKIKPALDAIIRDNGTSEEINGYMFRKSFIQRMTYNMATIMEEIDDESLRLEMLKPNKTFIDKYLKENIEVLGDTATILRKNMIADGEPYTVIKLEKL